MNTNDPGQRAQGRIQKNPAGCTVRDRPRGISVGEEGFEPSRPFGHTDLNRARLPFRHPPG